MQPKQNDRVNHSLNLQKDSSIQIVNDVKELQLLMQPIQIADLPKRSTQKEFVLLEKITNREPNIARLENSKHNQPLNRYCDVLPYVDNLVTLSSGKEITPSNYINANFIHSPFVEGALCNFIATQGPLKKTVEHFWKMVDLYKVKIIIGIVEKSAMDSKCFQYWPLSNTLETEHYSVSSVEEKSTNFIHKKVLSLKNKESGATRMIEHFHIINWIDHAELENADFKEFIGLLDYLLKIEKQAESPPIIVHCSAGIGRTGSFICSYYLYWQWVQAKKNKAEFYFSIFSLVRHIREQRFGAVQTYQQYKFLHDLVPHFESANL